MGRRSREIVLRLTLNCPSSGRTPTLASSLRRARTTRRALTSSPFSTRADTLPSGSSTSRAARRRSAWGASDSPRLPTCEPHADPSAPPLIRSFEERGEAFDFNVALQDHLKHLSAPSFSSSSSSSTSTTAAAKPAEPKKDFSLKEGQTFSISIPGGAAGGRARPAKKEPAAGGGGLFALPPPPPPASRRRE